MIIIGIDPGPNQSALVVYDTDSDAVMDSMTEDNPFILDVIRRQHAAGKKLAVEQIVSYGQRVGVEVFDTVYWSGRFIEAWGGEFVRIPFREIGKHLCNAGSGVKESQVRQVLIDRFGPGRRAAIGIKAAQGPLYSVKNHQWSALAVAVTIGDGYEGA